MLNCEKLFCSLPGFEEIKIKKVNEKRKTITEYTEEKETLDN